LIDGLYVLLKPEQDSPKARKRLTKEGSESSSLGSVPTFLTHLVEKRRPPAAETCSWSLSGPQYPIPTAIQQRYCYPKGDDLEYSSYTGGALFTMCGRDGKEKLEFRLLHVYRSVKRACNQVLKGDDDAMEQRLEQQPQPARAKLAKKRLRVDSSKDLVVDSNNINANDDRKGSGKKKTKPSLILKSSASATSNARERLAGWQQQDQQRSLPPSREPSVIDTPVAILTPRLPITTGATNWRSLAVRLLQCTDGPDDVDESCYREVLDFLKYQKGHRIIPEQQGRRSNDKKRKLNEALDVLWASTSTSSSSSSSDGGVRTSDRQGNINGDSNPPDEVKPDTARGTPQSILAAAATSAVETTSKSSPVTSLLSMRTRKAFVTRVLSS
jgi:hypothetical protein